MKRILALLPLVLLGACSVHDHDATNWSPSKSLGAGSSNANAMAFASELPDNAANAPVAAYASYASDLKQIGATKEHRYGDGLIQEIRLPGDGDQNVIQIWIRNQPQTLDEAIPMEKPSEASVRTELTKQFSGMPMKVVDRQQYNAYGRYGMAVGSRTDGVRCVYLWQWIDDATKLAAIPGAMQVSLRARVCKSTASIDELATAVSSVHLGSSKPTPVADKVAVTKPQKPASAIAENKAVATAKSARPARIRPAVAAVQDTPVFADGTPHYIVPLPTSVSGNAALAASASSRTTSAMPMQTAGITTNRLNLPPQAFQPSNPGSIARADKLIAEDVTGSSSAR